MQGGSHDSLTNQAEALECAHRQDGGTLGPTCLRKERRQGSSGQQSQVSLCPGPPTPLSWPQVGADAVSHGATGKGNDQVRFEVG